MQRLVRWASSNTVLALAGQGFASGTNFLTGLLIGRLCTPEEYGLYFLGFTILNFVIEMQTAFIATPYMVYAPRLAPRQRARYTGSALAHQLGVCLGAAALMAGVALIAAAGYSPAGFAPVAWALALFMALVLLREFARRVLFSNLEMRAALALDAAGAVLQLGALALLARFGWLGPASAYAALGFASAITVAAWLAAYRRRLELSSAGALEDLARNWAFARWAIASAAVWSVSVSAYPWLVSYFRGTGEAGVWAACMTIVNLGNILLMGMQNFLGPRIAVEYAERGGEAMRRYVWILAVTLGAPLLVIGIAIFFAGDFVVTLFYGAPYAGHGLVLALLVINLVLMAMGFVFSRGLFALERADIDFAVNFIALFVLLTAGVYFVWRFGVAGAAAGLLLANAASCGVRGWAFNSSALRAAGAAA